MAVEKESKMKAEKAEESSDADQGEVVYVETVEAEHANAGQTVSMLHRSI